LGRGALGEGGEELNAESSDQKFKRGDVIQIADDLGTSMSHFRAACEAIVIGSYADQFGGSDSESFTLMYTDDGEQCSWYYGRQLTFVREGGEVEIEAIDQARKEREAIESELQWIVDHFEEGCRNLPGASLVKLMSMIGIDKPWGARGEGMTYYDNAMGTITLLQPVLRLRDVAKLEEFCARYRAIRRGVD
jgi:hypothetical protein